jgi:hypothetical protein
MMVVLALHNGNVFNKDRCDAYCDTGNQARDQPYYDNAAKKCTPIRP